MADLRLCLLILGMMLSKVSSQGGCEYEGAPHAEGDMMTFGCFEHTCSAGEWMQGDLAPGCCEHHGEGYEEGDTMGVDCSIHVCMSGHWVDTEDPDPECNGMDGDHYNGDNYMGAGYPGDGMVIHVQQIVNEH